MRLRAFRGVWICALALAAFALVASGCGSSDDDSSGASTSSGTSTSASSSEKTGVIDYGLISAFSGSTASWGKAERTAVQLGIDKVNEQGIKIGDTVYKLKLHTYDSAYDPTKAASAAREALSRDNIKYLENLGAGTVAAVQPLTERGQVLLICACGGDTFLGTRYPLTFRPYYDVPSSLRASLEYLKKNSPDATKLQMIYPDDDAGHTNGDRSLAYAKELGFDATMNYVDRSTQDLAPLMTKVVNAKPDVVDVGPSPSDLYTGIVKQGSQLGFKGPYVFPDTLELDTVAKAAGKDALNGSLSSPCNLKASSQVATDFVRGFESMAGMDVQWWTAQNYDNILLLAKAFEKAQSLDTTKVADALATVSVEGATAGGGTVDYSVEVGGLPRAFSVPYPVCEVADGALKQVTDGSGT